MREILIKHRKSRKLTQQEVADDLHITRSFYGMIETGNRNPTIKLALEIAKYFNADVKELFFEDNCHDTRHSKSSTA
ncbi:helix-turn-helix transcriptional regulator [Candidatus Contubernalis alkaliaceticus]|uniref:helix-turn-helix transcriptional regulator n=1 Tax=Candidatus Contubernalis alkaliaceticus TaxID=338645 RepID=UPI001F4C1AF7|nr:helix-turn-helix transcriptional regulator [Candidatus Contubernalis alkalaceticus]UNC91651.1 helix-turn-helix transcriptional regulator [Candidatus Contubernalis alkalaceticus]